MGKNNQATKAISQFEAIEQVVILADDSKLSPEFFEKAAPYLQAVADKQALTMEQALMLCLAMNFCDNGCVKLGSMGSLVDLPVVHMLKYLNDLDALVARGFLKHRRSMRGECYAVRQDVIKALKQDKRYEPVRYRGINSKEFFEVVEYVFTEGDDIAYKQEAITNLLSDNPQLAISQAIKAHHLDDDNTLLLMAFCHLCVNNDDNMVDIDDIRSIIENKSLVRAWSRLLAKEQHPLQQKKLVEFSQMGPMVDSKYYCLSDKAKCELLGDLGFTSTKKQKKSKAALPKDFVAHKSIVAKQMFYTRDNESQVNRLAELLDESKFRDVCRRMKQRGMRTGFACLFYGAPGTGKTETVMQLARLTKRNVMVVDFAQIRSKWVGDSEKNIKGVFTRYRDYCAKTRRKPILLFNEADAVIGIRREEATYSVDKMENTMQNIILQEMEQFDGIMIATTNLAQNMDSAFERRFLYKIQFERPDASVRTNLWQGMIPELNSKECQSLGNEFDLSGGQIENVARKYAINSILCDIEPDSRLEELTKLCREEHISNAKSDRCIVGFAG